jgi:hypothetical protein
VATPAESEEGRDRRQEALLREYAEVANNFRLLTDIRFKLLAFLPVAAVAAAALKGTGPADARTAAATLGLSFFGLWVTAGLMRYNARNDQLYNELVGRAADIERRVGLPDGAFAHRPNPWLVIRLPLWRLPVDHGASVATIYTASIVLWLFVFLYSAVQLIAYNDTDPPWWVVGGSVVTATAVTFGVRHLIGEQRGRRSKDMRTAAVAAVRLAESNPSAAGFHRCASSIAFRTLCGGLLNGKVGTSRAFRTLCGELRVKPRNPEEEAARILANLRQDAPKDDVMKNIESRASFYADELERESSPYRPPLEAEPPLTRSCYFVALITDLSPRWVLDCATGRRVKIDVEMPPEHLMQQEFVEAAAVRPESSAGESRA